MASSPITSWQINGETMETVSEFIFLDSKITADRDCSHEIKRWCTGKTQRDGMGREVGGGNQDGERM